MLTKEFVSHIMRSYIRTLRDFLQVHLFIISLPSSKNRAIEELSRRSCAYSAEFWAFLIPQRQKLRSYQPSFSEPLQPAKAAKNINYPHLLSPWLQPPGKQASRKKVKCLKDSPWTHFSADACSIPPHSKFMEASPDSMTTDLLDAHYRQIS